MKYFYTLYRPDQIVISVAGHVTHRQILKKITPLVKKAWPKRPKKVAPKTLQLPKAPKPGPGKWWIHHDSEQVQLIWGVEGPNYTSKDRFAAFLLNVYLG